MIGTMTPGELGRILRRRRIELKLTQAQLAARAKVSRPWLIRLEAGHPNAELGRVLRVIRALDTHLTIDTTPPARPGPDSTEDLDTLLAAFDQ